MCKAFEMYQASDLFRKAYSYAVGNYDYVSILSARYGLLLPDEVIEPYELTLYSMNNEEQRRWAERVFDQMENKLPIDQISEVIFHAERSPSIQRCTLE